MTALKLPEPPASQNITVWQDWNTTHNTACSDVALRLILIVSPDFLTTQKGDSLSVLEKAVVGPKAIAARAVAAVKASTTADATKPNVNKTPSVKKK